MNLYKLFPGCESEEKVRKLAIMARLTSGNKVNALVEHYVNGRPQTGCGHMFGLSQQAIDLAAKKINKMYKLSHEVVSLK